MSLSHRRIAEPLLAALLALGAVGLALVSQHVYGLQPCPWCVLQRLVFVLGAGVALLEASALMALHRASGGVGTGLRMGCQASAGLRLVLALSGAAAAGWQHFVAAAQASCNLTLADQILAMTRLDGLLPDIFQPRASCVDAKAWLLGMPYEFWSAALFALLAVAALTSVTLTRTSKA